MTMLLQGAGLQIQTPVAPPDPGIALRADTKAYWTLNETSGNLLDSKNGFTLDSNSAGAVLGATGKIGRAVSIPTELDYVGVSTAGLAFIAAPFAISFWVKFGEFVNGDIRNVFVVEDSATNRVNSWFYVDDFGGDGHGIIFGISPTDTDGLIVELDRWYFVMGEYDSVGRKLRLTIDNSTVSEVNAPNPNLRIADRMRIGGPAAGTTGQICTIDEVLMLNRIFTQAERDYLWNSGAGRALFPAP